LFLLCRLQHGAINFAEAASSGIGLIIAGNDTSGLGVSALLATLPLFPQVVDKLRQEQQQVISVCDLDLDGRVGTARNAAAVPASRAEAAAGAAAGDAAVGECACHGWLHCIYLDMPLCAAAAILRV
jgi:cytochrome P450